MTARRPLGHDLPHVRVPCPRCGVPVGWWTPDTLDRWQTVTCRECDYDATGDTPGDDEDLTAWLREAVDALHLEDTP